MDRAEDRRAEERPGGHAQERQRADHAERARPCAAREQVRGRRGRDRDQRAAADRLDEARGDQRLERRRHAREQAPEREHDEGAQEEAPRAVQVGQAPGEGHRDHVHEQVAVDDPGRLAEARPAARVGDDRRQGDGRDHQLEAGEEHAGAQDGEQDVPVAARERFHGRECRRDRRNIPPSGAPPPANAPLHAAPPSASADAPGFPPPRSLRYAPPDDRLVRHHLPQNG